MNKKCLWCGKFMSMYDDWCDEDCFEKWNQNTDEKGKRFGKKLKK